MLFIILMILGYALCIEEEEIRLTSAKADAVAVISLFMILGLTFSVSLYGIKKLVEKTPKHMYADSPFDEGFIPRKQKQQHEVISF